MSEEEASEPKKAGFSGGRVSLVLGVLILLLVGLVLWPMVMRQKAAADRTTAISHCKCVGLALLEFEQEFGSFPNEKTAELVKRKSKTRLDLTGSSSNAMFRQLMAFGIQSELIFYCVHPEGSRKPDQDISEGKVLEAGETGFSYVCGFDTKANPGTSLMMAPMKIGTETFWAEPYGGKAVVLRADNSVEAPVIRESDGRAMLENGKTLFDTGDETVWGEGYGVDLRHPEMR